MIKICLVFKENENCGKRNEKCNDKAETLYWRVAVACRHDDVGSGSVDMDKKPANWNSVEFQRPSKALTVPLTFSKTATKLLENQTALKAV